MRSMTPDRLLAGLDAIAASLSTRPQALALLALGSCGVETQRLDAFSDLDFFVIVEDTAKADFIDDLDWLTTGAPLVFAHRNTHDGYKTLDSDGVLCEFAVFHPAELAGIPFAPGRIVWGRDGFDGALLEPNQTVDAYNTDWTITEAMTNILVGLKRHLRGEIHAARQSITVHAAHGVCRALMAGQQGDPYNPWRRIELLQPAIAAKLEAIMTQSSPVEAARGLLALLADGFDLAPALSDEIQRHLDQCDAR
jgi:hypothetical protein